VFREEFDDEFEIESLELSQRDEEEELLRKSATHQNKN
jgi:hypothetical protein